MDEAKAEDVMLLLTRSLRASMAEACSLLEACGHPCRAAPRRVVDAQSLRGGTRSFRGGARARCQRPDAGGGVGCGRAGGHWQSKREQEESDAPFVRCGFRAIDNG
jgi:hypothetical protein